MDSTNYLDTTEKLFHYYKSLAEKALAQVDESQFHLKPVSEDNSLAIIVRHMSGNMRSRFTDFFTTDGEKPWRNRDTEFEDPSASMQMIMDEWAGAWEIVFQALNEARNHPLDHLIYIRNEGHTVLEALQRQLAHYAYHVGQIVFLSRSIAGTNWKTLSIAKGKSGDFNASKFDQDKSKSFFTDKM